MQMPNFVHPHAPIEPTVLPSPDELRHGWCWQHKRHGWRGQLLVPLAGTARLVGKRFEEKGTDWTEKPGFQAIAGELSALPSAAYDVEILGLGTGGEECERYVSPALRGKRVIRLVIFDVPSLELQLRDRLEWLKALPVPRKTGHIEIAPTFPLNPGTREQIDALIGHAHSIGCEGLVLKRLDSLYGDRGAWLKLKHRIN
jgi:hypothetical protein